MNNIDLIRTSCKIFGLYFIILTIMNVREIILYFAGIFVTPDDTYGSFIILGQIYQAFFNVVVAITLINKSDWIISRLKIQTPVDMKLNLDKADWIELAIIVVSGLAILYSVPEILYKLTNYVYFNDFERNNRHFFWTGKNKADIFYSVFKFVIGLFSVLNARNFSRRLVKIGDKDDRLIA